MPVDSRKNIGLIFAFSLFLAVTPVLILLKFPYLFHHHFFHATLLVSRLLAAGSFIALEVVAVALSRSTATQISSVPTVETSRGSAEDLPITTTVVTEPEPLAPVPLAVVETESLSAPLELVSSAPQPEPAPEVTVAVSPKPSDSELLELCDSSPHVYCVVEFSGRMVESNDAARVLYRSAGLDRPGISWYDFIHPEDQHRTAMAVTTLLAGDTHIESFRNRIRCDHAYRWMEWTCISKAEVRRVYLVGQDVTEFQDAFNALSDSELRFRVAFNSMHEGMVLVDNGGLLSLANDSAQKILGVTSLDVQQHRLFSSKLVMLREDGSSLKADDHPLYRALATGEAQPDMVIGFHGKDGDLRWIEANAVPLFHQGELTPYAALSTLTDVTESREINEQIQSYLVTLEFQKEQLEVTNARLEEANHQLQTLATTDALTGLRNHRAFQERLVEEIMRAERYKTPLSLILLDVDQFKAYNDSFGHPAGDEVLRRLADILRDHARTHDLAARYGGEEFILLTPHTDVAGAEIVAERCRHAIEKVTWSIRPVTASFGLASLGYGIETGAELIACADHALYAAKAAGRNRVSTYSPALGKTAHN